MVSMHSMADLTIAALELKSGATAVLRMKNCSIVEEELRMRVQDEEFI